MMLLVKINSPTLKISFGMEGTINARVEKTAIIEGMPKTIAVFMFTNPLLK
jgi:hypothetical protein